MTALGIVIGAVGVALIWGAIANVNPLAELEVAIGGKDTTKAKGFKKPVVTKPGKPFIKVF